jgi:SecD/SecF fusion protein
MQRESNLRYYIILAVTVLCLYSIWPTGRYVYFSFTQKRPQAEAEIKGYDKQKADLQRGAIGLGLDLVGGVDVLLKVDAEKARTRLVALEGDRLHAALKEKRINYILDPAKVKDGLVLTVPNKADTHQVVNTIRGFYDSDRGAFEGFDEGAFHQTGQGTLKLSDRYFKHEMRPLVENARNIIERRVDAFGVTQPSVSMQDAGEGVSAIRVQVPGEKDPEYVISQLIRPAQLEFYLVHPKQMLDTDPPYQQAYTDEFYETRIVKDARGKDKTEFVPKKDLDSGYMGMEGEINDDKSPTGKKGVMYIVKDQPSMTGEHLRIAYVTSNPSNISNPIAVSFVLDQQGASDFRQITTANLRGHLAIALDGSIKSAPLIRSVIPNGLGEIEGSFSPQEAQDLAQVLKTGALPADLKADQKRTIGPTLGEQSLIQSMKAMAIAAVAITVFMIVYYGTAGFISIFALILNLLIIIACLGMFNATLTLSGIGGIILTIGMAVDANVLIYERIRDEILSGRPLRAAIRAGFGRAFPVIFDSNLTTLLSAFVLLQFGEGSVRGFALTMVFGLIANLFTGLTVTYALCSLWFRIRGSLSIGSLCMFRNPKINFIGLRFVSFSISGALILFCLVALTLRGGPDFAVDFKGGVLSEVRILNSTKDESQEITKVLPGEQSRVQKVEVTDKNDYLIRLALQSRPEGGSKTGDTEYTQKVIESKLTEKYTKDGVEFLGTTTVSKEVGQTFRSIALLVVIGATMCILAYLWFRFELVFGVAAVIALLHDLICTIGIITLWKVQMSLDVVSALLIMVGFSVNDTIVIFDRIRENSHTMFGRSFKEICDDAMNKSLSRTLITTGTVVGVMVVMYFFGGTSLVPFAKVMIVGGLIGTYSSDFVAAPLVYMWNEYKKGRVAVELGRKPTLPIQPQEPAPAMAAATAGTAGGTVVSSGTSAPQRRGRR